MGGFFQILFGVFRLGKYVSLVLFSVISGFMSGIAVIIILLQLAPLFGYASSASIMASFKAIPGYIAAPYIDTLQLGLITLFIILLCPKRVAGVVPPALIALITGTLLYLFGYGGQPLATIGNIPTGLPSIQLPIINYAVFQEMLFAGIMLAVLGPIDSLLTFLVADNMTKIHMDPSAN